MKNPSSGPKLVGSLEDLTAIAEALNVAEDYMSPVGEYYGRITCRKMPVSWDGRGTPPPGYNDYREEIYDRGDGEAEMSFDMDTKLGHYIQALPNGQVRSNWVQLRARTRQETREDLPT